jgi:peptidoglycan/LPS O-acetylase OafA/YrhL
MEEKRAKGLAAKVITVIGTLLVWTPMALTVLTSAIGTIATGRLHFDYLMPAELFPAALAGAILLLWSAKRSGRRFRTIGISFISMLFFMGSIIVIPSVTGLASGDVPPSGMPFVVVMVCLALYVISQIAVGIGGILLWRDR